MRDMLAGPLAFAAHDEHIWWGVSVEDKKYGLPRLDALRDTPAAMRFLSVEPLLEDLGEIDLTGIDWVIVGGESGHGARPMDKEWVLNIQRQCLDARIDFFFKQWGGVQKKKAGRLLNGRTYDAMPARPSIPVLPLRDRNALVAKVSTWLPNVTAPSAQRIA
jgi:protein gp37